MNGLLKQFNNFVNLELEGRDFSPITKINTHICLKYLESIDESLEPQLNQPFFFLLSENQSAAIWLSISLLLNSFKEDYRRTEGMPEIDLIRGKKYSVYGSIGIFKGISKNKYLFEFEPSAPATAKCSTNVIYAIKETSQTRAVNKYKNYYNNKIKAKNERTPLSKILEPEEGVPISEEVFKSKILLVTGRGNTKEAHNLLDKVFLYDQAVGKIISPNENLIIKPDLKSYQSFFDENYLNALQEFITWTKKLYEVTEIIDLKSEMKHFIGIVSQQNNISEDAGSVFHSILEKYIDSEPRLIMLEEIYPGITNSIPDTLKAVVISDLNQIFEYPNTINGLLSKKIPVIFISDKSQSISYEQDTFLRLFNTDTGLFKEAFRFNWNKSKIKTIEYPQESENDFLDIELWKTSTRFSKQTINIEIKDEPDNLKIDKKLKFLANSISNLDGFEKLKTAFFNYLYPALFAFKNSNRVSHCVKELLDMFIDVWKDMEEYVSNTELRNNLNEIITHLDSCDYLNTKSYNDVPIFTQTVNASGCSEIIIPADAEEEYDASNNYKSLTFTGFPYKEYSGKYLYNAIQRYFIPDLSVICWPYEGELTYNYIRRRLLAGHFTDNISELIEVSDDLLMKKSGDIESEVDKTLIIQRSATEYKFEDKDEEYDLSDLDNLQYEKYKSESSSASNRYIVKCNIIQFNDGCFMFLPTDSTVLAEYENEKGTIIIRKLKFNELSTDLRVFRFKRDQISYSDILEKNKVVNKAKSDLKIWRDALIELSNQYPNINELSKYLNDICEDNKIKDANPSVNNIKRWLFDEELIAPDTNNLSMIIIAGIKENILAGDIDAYTDKCVNAFSCIYGAHISVGHKLKSAIVSKLKKSKIEEDDFNININAAEVEIKAKTISELQKNNVEVEYSNTRKYIC